MKLPKYNLEYNTRDLVKSLATIAAERNRVAKVRFLPLSNIQFYVYLLYLLKGSLFPILFRCNKIHASLTLIQCNIFATNKQ